MRPPSPSMIQLRRLRVTGGEQFDAKPTLLISLESTTPLGGQLLDLFRQSRRRHRFVAQAKHATPHGGFSQSLL